MKLRPRHHDLQFLLGFQGPLVDAPLLAYHWQVTERVAASELEAMASSGELRRGFGEEIRCMPPTPELVTDWAPPAELPRAGSISHRARKRWYGLACSRRPYYSLSPQAARSRGVRPVRLEPRKLSHDLGVTALVLHLTRERGEMEFLRGEDQLAYRFSDVGLKCPDLFLCDATGRVLKTIEYASGSYPVAHIESFFRFHFEQQLPTEVYI